MNNSHIHDMGKWVFSDQLPVELLFWFSQFRPIWYSNIPEEVTYFQTRWEHYKVLFWLVFAINFPAAHGVLMSRDAKPNPASRPRSAPSSRGPLARRS